MPSRWLERQTNSEICALVSCAQLWHYVYAYPDDSKGLKTLVWAAWTVDTAHQALICYSRMLSILLRGEGLLTWTRAIRSLLLRSHPLW
jgi:hypothetical protein